MLRNTSFPYYNLSIPESEMFQNKEKVHVFFSTQVLFAEENSKTFNAGFPAKISITKTFLVAMLFLIVLYRVQPSTYQYFCAPCLVCDFTSSKFSDVQTQHKTYLSLNITSFSVTRIFCIPRLANIPRVFSQSPKVPQKTQQSQRSPRKYLSSGHGSKIQLQENYLSFSVASSQSIQSMSSSSFLPLLECLCMY